MVQATQETLPDLLAAFEHSADGAFAVDADDRIVYWNASAERIMGYTPDDAVGRLCYELLAGNGAGEGICSPHCSVMRCALRGGYPESYDVAHRTRSGELRQLNVSIVVLKGRGRRSTLAVHIFRDVTARREIEGRAHVLLGSIAAGADEHPDLTRREREVLRMLACGFNNRQIAAVLGISPTTVRNHIEHLLGKMGVHSKLEAVVQGARLRLF